MYDESANISSLYDHSLIEAAAENITERLNEDLPNFQNLVNNVNQWGLPAQVRKNSGINFRGGGGGSH